MDAEERECRVGHGVDEVADEPAGGVREVVVLPAEGHDPHVASGAGALCDAVGLEARAVDGVAGAHEARCGLQGHVVCLHTNASDARAQPDLAARLLEQRAVGAADGGVVRDAGAGHVQGADPGGVRLDRA